MRFIAFVFLTTAFTVSCSNKTAIDPNEILHDNSSKVWVASEYEVNGESEMSPYRDQTIYLSLFADGSCRSGILKHFDSVDGAGKGQYILDQENSLITFHWEGQPPIEYVLLELNQQKLAFQLEDGSAKLVFVPYFAPPANSQVMQGGGTISVE
jgi:hypothetical protein